VAAVYIDTSALVKLVIDEPESAALRGAVDRWSRAWSSELVTVELIRAVRRSTAGDGSAFEALALTVLSGVALYGISSNLLLAAARLDPTTLRSLDAIHLATALELVDVVDRFISYDRRLQGAASAAGFVVEAPA
jgi:predicted nucleic acid-binding protein